MYCCFCCYRGYRYSCDFEWKMSLDAVYEVNSIDAFGDHLDIESQRLESFRIYGAAGAFGIMAYYMVLGGWVMNYIVNLISGELDISTVITKEYAKQFYDESITNSPWHIIASHMNFVLVNYVILARGIIGGIERAVKYLMPLLLSF